MRKAIADACHRRGKPLIVDEAWGAHLPFHEDLPTWAMNAGADVMVYAALDGWRRQMAEHGHALPGAALGLADRVRGEIGTLPGLRVLQDEFLGAEASHDLDPLHVVVDLSALKISGYDAADWLREHQRVDMGLSDHRRIEATLSVADDDQTAGRLVWSLHALTEHAAELPRAKPVELPSAGELELEPVMLPATPSSPPRRRCPPARRPGASAPSRSPRTRRASR